MWHEWLISDWSDLFWSTFSFIALYFFTLLAMRIRGLRSLTKMSPGDFIMTLVLASVFASAVVNPRPSMLLAMAVIATSFILQTIVCKLRMRVEEDQPILYRAPMLVMKDGQIFEDQLQQAHITLGDLRAKLREANVLQLDQVRAVVVESTGDISVLHADKDSDITLDPWLLKGVPCGVLDDERFQDDTDGSMS